jgi:glycosyltransferase involved in cell wall biosynthesis
VTFVATDLAAGAGQRFWQEQRTLPRLLQQANADVLISAGNFALRKSPVPQILLSRNSLYTSSDFYRDLKLRRDYKLWLDTRIKGSLAKRSIQWADCTVAPSQAFADELQRWSGRKVMSIHHGFDRESFFGHGEPLSPAIQQKLDGASGDVKLLFVSHYNYYRNFETLFRALPMVCDRLQRKVKLLLTCKLRSEANPGSYQADRAAALVQSLGIADNVVELGSVPYRFLHHVYRAADVYVTPAYAESFAHPLVEAMWSGLPVIASDIAVHHEICEAAALYFERFSPAQLAEKIVQLAKSETSRQQLKEHGRERAEAFSWKAHAEAIVALSTQLRAQRCAVDQPTRTS